MSLLDSFIFNIFSHHDTCFYRVRLGPITRSCALLVSMLTRVVTTAQTLISCILFGIILNGFLIENLPFLYFRQTTAAQLNLSAALPTRSKLVYLKYYRALSDGLCLDKRNCEQCMVKNRLSLLLLCCCQRSDGDCSCIACKKQHPSLLDICADKYFRDMRQFTFTTFTIFSQYVDAIVSGRVSWERLLPPAFSLS